MTRKVDLITYLPQYLREYRETVATLEAENPEFILAWDAADRVLRNVFIETADEYGISRFEGILGIHPTVDDTLETRRSRVRARWFNDIPYTLRVFLERLEEICGAGNFTVTKAFLSYRIDIETSLEFYGKVEELEYLIETMMPCNMVVVSHNGIPCGADGKAYVAGGVCYTEHIVVTSEPPNGGGTTANYMLLSNLPQINGNILLGNMLPSALGLLPSNATNDLVLPADVQSAGYITGAQAGTVINGRIGNLK